MQTCYLKSESWKVVGLSIRLTGLAICSLFAMTAVGWCCSGQVGKVIFSDDFSDDSGGWENNANTTVAQNAYQIKANAASLSSGVSNIMFDAIEGDYCVTFSFPSDPADHDNPDSAGLTLLSDGGNNKYAVSVSSNGTAWVTRLINGQNSPLMPETAFPVIKKDPGGVNELRAIVLNQKIVFYINGTSVKTLRIPAQSMSRFGFWAGDTAKAPAADRVFSFKSYQVTTGH